MPGVDIRALTIAAAAAAVVLGLGAAACAAGPDSAAPTAANLTSAIDGYLVANPNRICTRGFMLPFDRRVDGRDDPVLASGLRDDLTWLDGLAKAGLVVKSRTSAYGPGGSAPIPIDEYVLSADGQRYVDDPAMVHAGRAARFCVAETDVATIVAMTPPKQHGTDRVTTVRYRPALAKRAPWATTKRTRAAMPWLGAWAQHQLGGERTVTLHLTPDGWEVR